MFKRKVSQKRIQKKIVQKYINQERAMKKLADFQLMKQEANDELVNHLIPFWKGMRDSENGGYFGEMSYDLKVNKSADKSSSSTARILGFFSVCYWNIDDDTLFDEAKHAYHFLKDSFLDRECGGVYHMLDYQGAVKDATKYTHEQAFAIYSLAAYYDASGDEEALDLAKELYELIETKCRDEVGYISVFTRDFKRKESERFSRKGIPASRTMHTLVHVLEGYTGLLLVLKRMKEAGKLTRNEDSWMKEIEASIKKCLDIISGKVYNHELGRLEAFFDEKYNSIIDLHPYGYDIETAWLIDQSTEVLGDKTYQEKMSKITKKLVKTVYNTAFDGHSMDNECENGFVDHRRAQWVQTEAVVAFLNAYQKDLSRTEYAEAAKEQWKFIKDHMIDRRPGSEWFSVVSDAGVPDSKAPIVDAMKSPYHHCRMCAEIVRRVTELESACELEIVNK